MRKIRFFIKFPEGNLSFFKITNKDYGETESQKKCGNHKKDLASKKMKYKRVEKYYYDISYFLLFIRNWYYIVLLLLFYYM